MRHHICFHGISNLKIEQKILQLPVRPAAALSLSLSCFIDFFLLSERYSISNAIIVYYYIRLLKTSIHSILLFQSQSVSVDLIIYYASKGHIVSLQRNKMPAHSLFLQPTTLLYRYNAIQLHQSFVLINWSSNNCESLFFYLYNLINAIICNLSKSSFFECGYCTVCRPIDINLPFSILSLSTIDGPNDVLYIILWNISSMRITCSPLFFFINCHNA